MESALKNKTELSAEIKRWINHSRIISMTSKLEYYKSSERITALGFAKELLKMVDHPENHDVLAICKFTLMLRNRLFAILPIPTNPSYKSSVEKLDLIMQSCKCHIDKFKQRSQVSPT